MFKYFIIILCICSICFGYPKYFVLHPDGNDLNGGGYYDDSVTVPDWTDWHSSFDAVASQSGCAISDSGGTVRITVTGAFTSALVNTLVNCDFSDTYEDGRYAITAAGTNYIEIPVAYSSDVPTVTVYIGGAIKSPDEACALAYGTNGDVLLLPANQTTQTVNEVDGSDNQILCVTEGAKLDMYSVDDSTGVKVTSDDSNDWAVIKAKTGSTWAANSAMLYMQSGIGGDTSNDTTFKADKIVFDGNILTPRIVQFGDNSGDIVNLYIGDIVIQNSKSDGVGWYGNAYYYVGESRNKYIRSIKIDNCQIGLYNAGARTLPNVLNYFWINNCSYGMQQWLVSIQGAFNNTIRYIITNCTIGLSVSRYDMMINCGCLFADNTTDIKITAYSSAASANIVRNCLFFNDNASGYIFDGNNDALVSLEFHNCVLGTANGAAIYKDIEPTLTNCQTISADPFMNKATGDYRLNPAFADLAKIWDWDSMTNVIGATTPAEPAAGGTMTGGSITVTED